MEGYGEGDRELFLGKLADSGHDTAGGKGDMAVADIESRFGIYELQELDNVIVVVKRLADAHHYDIGNALTRIALCGDDLAEKLGGEKVAHLATDGRGAEAAAHTAADLA